jgi:ribosome biogenesis GTPase
MHPLSFGGFIIDTPGIREFGVVDLNNAELSHYFKEMKPYIGKCRFNNCKHMNEPQCSVLEAIEQGIIPAERYQSYLSIMANEDVFN